MTQTVGVRPQDINIDVAAGEPVDFTVPVLDATNAAVSADGWTGLAQVRSHAGGRLLHTLTLAASSAGFRLTATAAETALWAAWRSPLARWDLWITPTGEDPRPLADGRVFVRSPISTT